MIPLRLELKDFLSYAEPAALDFASFDVACLSGDNGVGKSALLDAITWALFGAARGCEGGQNQDRLIRDGCVETRVDYTFALGDATYRIVRRRSRTAKGDTKGDVRFLVADGEGWKNIAAETLKATDAKISSVLRMDYPTFTASAFFLQGHADDFLSRMSPTDRREVFARLLDLGTYEQLEEAARLRAREAERSRLDAAARVGELESQTVDVHALEADLADNAAEHARCRLEHQRAQDAVDASRRELAEIDTRVALLQKEQDELDAAQALVRDLDDRIDAGGRELTEIDSLLERAAEVDEAARRMEELARQDDEARAAQQEAAELRRQAAELAAAAEAEARSIAERVEDTRKRIVQLSREQETLREAADRLTRLEEELDNRPDDIAAIAEARAQHGAREIAAATADEHARALDERIATSSEALSVLTGGAHGGGECPVCGSALDAAHRARARTRIQAELREAKVAHQTARAVASTERKEAKRLAEEIARLEDAAAERERQEAVRRALRVRLERMEPLGAELAAYQDALRSDEAALERGPAPELRAALEELERAAADRYDQAAHTEIRRTLRSLEPFAALAGRIDEARRRRTHIAQNLDSARRRRAALADDLRAREGRIDDLVRTIAGRSLALEAASRAERARDVLTGRLTELTAGRARLEERLETAKRVVGELEAARATERLLGAEHRRYRRLAQAFGRGGIPDLVIDNARPQLEEDANRILGRLSDHEMSVQFLLNRDTKSGKNRDTFEALVHHDGGVRDYAMFSGGEAFRVAFAVRLAMSKLLVHRAGARLETLVIDEGFGTQDPHGRERLVEAINLARQEFAKIIVITHLEDLKDQFGTQIVVTKGRDGSELRLIEA